MKVLLKSFIAGFASTLIFHQGLIGAFYLTGAFAHAPFDLTPTPPLGVPSVFSLSFFGGVWGVLIWKMVSKTLGRKHWVQSIVYGAVGPTAVALILVFPLKGVSFQWVMIPGGLLVNAVWGVGNSLLMRLMGEFPRSQAS